MLMQLIGDVDSVEVVGRKVGGGIDEGMLVAL